MKKRHHQINHRRGGSIRTSALFAGILISSVMLGGGVVSAQEAAAASPAAGTSTSTEALAKAAQNPIANMISLPIQNNMDFGLGPKEGFKNTTNIQPVYPFELGDDWNLITRTIVPVIYQSELVEGAWGPSSCCLRRRTTCSGPTNGAPGLR